MQIDPGKAAAQRSHRGKTYCSCSTGCAEKSDQSPSRYVDTGAAAKGGAADAKR